MIEKDFRDNMQPFRFKNPELEQYTNAIRETIGTGKKSSKLAGQKAAIAMFAVSERKLYEREGFSNISQYGQTVFGFKKTYTYQLIKIGSKLTITSPMGKVKPTDFSAGQLLECATLSNYEFVNIVKSGVISPEMTAKKIREAVKTYKAARGGTAPLTMYCFSKSADMSNELEPMTKEQFSKIYADRVGFVTILDTNVAVGIDEEGTIHAWAYNEC